MKSLTTGDIARICGVSATTAMKWIDRGLLKGCHLPGSNYRRTTVEHLREFMQQHKVPIVESELTHRVAPRRSNSKKG